MGMSISYGEPNDEESIATIHRALEIGVNFIVTSDAYGGGVNEALVGRALKGKRSAVLIGTKFGNLRRAGGNASGLTGGHPDYVPFSLRWHYPDQVQRVDGSFGLWSPYL